MNDQRTIQISAAGSVKRTGKIKRIKHTSGLKKDELIDRMLEEDAREAAERETAAQEEETPSVEKGKQEETFRPRQNTYTNRNYNRTQEEYQDLFLWKKSGKCPELCAESQPESEQSGRRIRLFQ